MSLKAIMLASFPEAQIDPPDPKPACCCDRARIARQIVALAHVEAEATGVDARQRSPLYPSGGDYARFLGRVEDALDDVYRWDTCADCAPLNPADEDRL